jgi:hypothetical protein
MKMPEITLLDWQKKHGTEKACAAALALPATDIDGDDRKIDDPAVADTGNGTPPIVDIGAFELNSNKGLPWLMLLLD